MKSFVALAILGLLNCGLLISGEGYDYDITTTYKFNTLEEFDENGDIITTYLNTCDVSVHPQSNAVGLPYFNIEHKDDKPQVLYPLKSPIIPSLDYPYPESQWKTLTSDGNLEGLRNQSIPRTIPDDSFFIYEDFFSLLKKSSVVYKEFEDQNYQTRNYYGSSYGYRYYLDVSRSNTVPYLFLFVEVKKYYAKDFAFNLRKSDEKNVIEVRVFNVNSTIEVRASWLGEHWETVNYEKDDQRQISIYISLVGDMKIYDAIGRKTHSINVYNNEQFSKIYQSNSYNTPITFKALEVSQDVLVDDTTIASPWIQQLKSDRMLFIIYYRKYGGRLTSHLKQKDLENNIIELESNEYKVVELGNYNQSKVNEMVMTKIHIKYPSNRTGEKQIQIKAEKDVYIKSIWEADDLELYRIHSRKSCRKDDLTEIYNVAIKGQRHDQRYSICYNGGFPDKFNETCVCPPGFVGNTCEVACGRNYFGQECSNLCSETGTDCKGMVLCTPDYGCSCAPGYYGNQCLEQCSEGTYGADCKETCGQCKDGCDKYTGHCIGDCDTPYLEWPSCKYPKSYWTGSPEIIESKYDSIKLGLNLSISSIVKFLDVTQFYKVQYRKDVETIWSNSTYEEFRPEYNQVLVENLEAGRKYFFRVLLVDNYLRTSDPKLSKITEGLTSCGISKISHMNVTKVTNDSIALALNNDLDKADNNECPFTSYTLDIETSFDDYIETRKIQNIKKKYFTIKNLKPSQSYLLKLKKNTVHGESGTLSSVTVSTGETVDKSLSVSGVTINNKGADIKINWLKSPIYKIYYVKYKLMKRLSCFEKELESPLQVTSTTTTNYTLSLEPNAQYQIFVTGDENQRISFHNQTVITTGRLPDVSPSLVKQKIRITNDTIQLHWVDPASFCFPLNGFFKTNLIEILDSQNIQIGKYESKDKKLKITQLSPKTIYKVIIRYVNHVGFNPQVYAEHTFTTKATSFLTPLDLIAYKTSANMIGIRWKIPENNSTITGINLKIQNNAENRSINITSPTSIQCKAWPSYVCYNITKLKQNTKYKVSVEIFSEEFPEGGSQKEIQAITRESPPSPVTDIKLNDISDTNITVSWRIPFMLNGLLRKFQIEVEHLSSFDESSCCQTISTLNYAVIEEKEIYSHVIENIQNASSYQVTIRAFTKRLGQEASKIIDIPPPILPLRLKPLVTLNGDEVFWEDEGIINNIAIANEMISDILVIVLPAKGASDRNYSSPVGMELSRYLKSNSWWLAHICPVSEEECSMNLGSDEQTDSPYGEVKNKPLTPLNKYTIVIVQINKYLSARSYTIAKSSQINYTIPDSTTGTLVDTTVTTLQYTEQEEHTDKDVGEDFHRNILDEGLEETTIETKVDDVTENPEPEYEDYQEYSA